MREARVFAVQVPARKDPHSGKWVEKYDLSAAEHFGRLVPVLPFGNVPKDPEAYRIRLYNVFKDFDFDHDSVLLLGDPVAIAQVVSVLTLRQKNLPLRVLKWDRRRGTYLVYQVGQCSSTMACLPSKAG